MPIKTNKAAAGFEILENSMLQNDKNKLSVYFKGKLLADKTSIDRDGKIWGEDVSMDEKDLGDVPCLSFPDRLTVNLFIKKAAGDFTFGNISRKGEKIQLHFWADISVDETKLGLDYFGFYYWFTMLAIKKGHFSCEIDDINLDLIYISDMDGTLKDVYIKAKQEITGLYKEAKKKMKQTKLDFLSSD